MKSAFHSPLVGAYLIVATLLMACAPQAGPSGGAATQASSAAAPKRVAAAVMGNAHTVYQKLNPGSNIPGIDVLEELVNSGLTDPDHQGNRRAQLAEAAPTLDNGLWKLLPDGRMETTWHIRDGVQWHDGAPFSSADLVFTARVVQDREFPVLRDPAYDAIEGVDAPDAATVVVRWKRPLLDADAMFSRGYAMPLPQHILDRVYSEDKATFLNNAYWSTEYVGAGPFALREFVAGSHLVLQANERYTLGRPKIDEITVQFISDPTTLVANMLAGQVELLLGRGLSLEQGLQLRDQWKDGKMGTEFPTTWIVIYPQFINARPAVVTSLQFRRALLYAVDRQAMVESIQAGLAKVAHSFLSPNQTDYQAIEARLPHYDYDSRQATQIIEGLGFHKGSDGTYQDASNQPLQLEIRTTNQDVNQKSLYSVVDNWQRLGIGVDPVTYPPQRATDLEYLTTYPALYLLRHPNDVRSVRNRHSNQTPLPDNNYVGANLSRYMNKDLDALIERYYAAISKTDRIPVLGDVIYHMADQLNVMGLYYDVNPVLIGNRLANVAPATGPGASLAWNAEQWDLVRHFINTATYP